MPVCAFYHYKTGRYLLKPEISGVKGSIVMMRRTRAAMRRGVRKTKKTERRGMKRRRGELRLSNILMREQLSNTEISRYVDEQMST